MPQSQCHLDTYRTNLKTLLEHVYQQYMGKRLEFKEFLSLSWHYLGWASLGLQRQYCGQRSVMNNIIKNRNLLFPWGTYPRGHIFCKRQVSQSQQAKQFFLSWDLNLVLKWLTSHPFEPLPSILLYFLSVQIAFGLHQLGYKNLWTQFCVHERNVFVIYERREVLWPLESYRNKAESPLSHYLRDGFSLSFCPERNSNIEVVETFYKNLTLFASGKLTSWQNSLYAIFERVNFWKIH